MRGKRRNYKQEKHESQDHPRRCGENNVPAGFLYSAVGSPPQVRGKRRRHQSSRVSPGITPAGAGKTVTYLHDVESAKDHPRRCGENKIALLVGRGSPGSPPQVRGKHVYHEDGTGIFRITPAGAGKTSLDDWKRCITEDHPRRCGENLCFQLLAATTAGSPPQVRGKLDGTHPKRLSGRITPAGAGKTRTMSLRTARQRDHPRRCGENSSSG